MERKKLVIRLTNYAHEAINNLVANSSEDDLQRNGEINKWSIKDHIAHLGFWLEKYNHRLIKRDISYKPVIDLDKENERIWRINKEKEWLYLKSRLDKAYLDLSQHQRLLSEYDLTMSDVLYPPDNRPLWTSLVESTCMHTIIHLVQINNERGEPQKSVQLFQNIFEDMQSLYTDAHWRAMNIYYLACLHITAGDREKSFELLKDSIQLDPGIKELPKDDKHWETLMQDQDFLRITCAD
jgi:tetratricopeptide (TPR) repeat protein